MVSKLHIIVGNVDVEFEGEEEFLKNEILPFINSKITTTKSLEDVDNGGDSGIPPKPPLDSGKPAGIPMITEMSVNTISGRLKVKSESELVIAACAFIGIIHNKPEFPRDEILNAMKTADHYYKESYRSNLSHSLEFLVKSGNLNEKRKGVYAFPQNVIDELRGKLA